MVRRVFYLVDEKNRRRLPDGRKGVQRQGKIKDVKKKVHAREKQIPQHGFSIILSGPVAMEDEKLVAATKNSLEV